MSSLDGSPRVKICGCTTTDDIDLATNAGADAIGVISQVSVDTHREVPIETARTLVRHASPFVTTVLVTMPDSAAEARELLAEVRPDVVQLHGGIDTDEIADIGADVPVILAVDADEISDVETALPGTAGLLLDSTDEHGAGGTGRTHDWERAGQLVRSLDVPVILAGGLTPDNITRAVETVRPYAVDVASGVEAENGKDPAVVRQFIRRAKGVKACPP